MMIADFFADYLISEGFENVFVSNRPDSPNDLICLTDETGIIEDYEIDYASDTPGLMVYVRGSYKYANQQIWDIHFALAGVNNLGGDDFVVSHIKTQALPAQIEIDQHGRRIFTAHYLPNIEHKTNHNRIQVN